MVHSFIVYILHFLFKEGYSNIICTHNDLKVMQNKNTSKFEKLASYQIQVIQTSNLNEWESIWLYMNLKILEKIRCPNID